VNGIPIELLGFVVLRICGPSTAILVHICVLFKGTDIGAIHIE